MQEQRVFSRNATYQKFEVLKLNRTKRHRYREFLVEGVRNINEAIANGWAIRAWLTGDGKPLSRWAVDLLSRGLAETHYLLSSELMAALSGKVDTSELMAIVAMGDWHCDPQTLDANPLLVLFDRPSNKGNLGTILRSCDALGVDGLILTGHGVDPYDPEVIVSSMGSFFCVPTTHIAEHTGFESLLAALRRRYPGFRVIGTSAHGSERLFDSDLSSPLLLMIGNETDGLNRALSEHCDSMVAIPMAANSSASSLNVGCAATVLFYEAMRQRLAEKPIGDISSPL